MKKLLTTTFLFLIFALSISAQVSEAEIIRLQLVNALERSQTEVRASRKLVDGMSEQLASKEQIIKRQTELAILSTEAINSLQSEAANLRLAIEAQTRAIRIAEAEIAELKKQRDATRAKLKRSRTVVKYLLITAGILGAIVIFK